MTITSLLDTDLYKLTMQAVVHRHFSDADVKYMFHNRSIEKKMTAEAVSWIREEITAWGELRFTLDEIKWLKEAVPFLPPEYLDFLKDIRLNPKEEVDISFNPEAEIDLVIETKGKWDVAIMYEIPILSIVSEAYFKFVDTDWNTEGQHELAATKARELIASGCAFSEFGTRRRRSKEVQRIVMQGIMDGAAGSSLFAGTSNVMFAKEFGVKPIGTVAHELMMGVAAYTQDYLGANRRAMDVWLDTVGKDAAGVALTDTFGTPQFLKSFVPPYSDIYKGVRQDSGDPLEYTKLISRHYYETLGLPRMSKVIVYSDSLDVEKCKQYRTAALDAGLVPSFGVGTCFTNDFCLKNGAKSKPLNIVMKISSVNGKPAVKLSDNIGKNTGDSEEVARVKEILGYTDTGDKIDEDNRW